LTRPVCLLLILSMIWISLSGCAGGHANIVVARDSQFKPLLREEAENPSAPEVLGCKRGDKEAKAAAWKAGWYLAGFAFSIITVAISFGPESPPEPKDAKGKNSEYVRCYGECYADTIMGERQTWAIAGAFTSYALIMALLLSLPPGTHLPL
jgi:hypothetical protein